MIEIIQKDTITITKLDTIFKEKIRYITKLDTMILYEHDSITDTIYITLPNEHKEATFKTNKDSLDLEAKILYHGYKAEIDTVEFAYKFHYTQEIPKKKERKWGLVWFVGPTVTGGVNFNVNNKTFDYGPSVGLSVGVGIGGIIK